MSLLDIRDLAVSFDTSAGRIWALAGVSFSLERGEVLALLRLNAPTGGIAELNGTDIAHARGRALRDMRRKMQVVFQDPYQSLNPRMRVDRLDREPWALHPDLLPRAQWPAEIAPLLVGVGLRPEHALRYPGEFSSGSGSAWRAHSRSIQPCWSVTSPSRRWTCRCRRRSSACWPRSGESATLPCCLLPMTSPWCATSRIG